MTHDLTTFDGALAAIAELPCTWAMDTKGGIAARATDALCVVTLILKVPKHIANRIADAASDPDHPDRIALEIACKLRERA